MGQYRLPVAIMPLTKLEVQSRQAFGPGALFCGGHFQALGASGHAPNEGEQQRVGAPGEEGTGCVGPEDVGWEVDAPSFGLFEAARVCYLAGRDDVGVARFYSSLLVSQQQQAAVPLEVVEHEEVVRVCTWPHL